MSDPSPLKIVPKNPSPPPPASPPMPPTSPCSALPKAPRNPPPAFAVPAAPMVARHVGRGPRLVDEDEPVGIEVELRLEPRLPALQDVGAVLLAGMGRLFLRVIPWRAKKRRIVP